MGNHIKEVAIVILGILEIAAIAKGIDGMFFAPVIALIAGIAGYSLADYVRKNT